MDLVELEKQNIQCRHPWETVRIKIIKEKIRSLLKDELEENRTINVLDVGSGDAYLIDQLASTFPNLTFLGIDIFYDEKIIETLYKQIENPKNVRLYSDWGNSELKKKSIDLVLFLDVLEHVPDDLRVMQDVTKLTSDPFKFIITVPAFQFLFANHDKFLQHYRRYNNKQLRALVNKANWNEIQSGYFYTSFLIPRFFIMLSEKILKPKEEAKGISTWNKSKGVTSFIEAILWIDYKLCTALLKIGIRLPGLSNFITGKREK